MIDGAAAAGAAAARAALPIVILEAASISLNCDGKREPLRLWSLKQKGKKEREVAGKRKEGKCKRLEEM